MTNHWTPARRNTGTQTLCLFVLIQKFFFYLLLHLMISFNFHFHTFLHSLGFLHTSLLNFLNPVLRRLICIISEPSYANTLPHTEMQALIPYRDFPLKASSTKAKTGDVSPSKHCLTVPPSQQPWESCLLQRQVERSSCCISNEARSESLDTRAGLSGFGWILARWWGTRWRSPTGQSKDDVEFKIDIVKDFQLSSEISLCGSKHVGSKEI